VPDVVPQVGNAKCNTRQILHRVFSGLRVPGALDVFRDSRSDYGVNILYEVQMTRQMKARKHTKNSLPCEAHGKRLTASLS
jgi:hypothetical protein